MPLIPTISELYTNINSDLRNKLDLSESDLKKVLDVFALALAGQFKISYLFLSDIQNNLFPDTADSSENGGTLERIGQIYLGRNRNPSTSGIFEVQVSGEIGSVLREGITFKSNDDSLNPGVLYVLDQSYSLQQEVDLITIRSLKGGVDNLLEESNTLTITEPVIGVDKTVTITQILEEPLSSEDIEDYRKAILKAIQLEPQGGAKTDYRLWSSDAQGVRNVYPYVKNGEAGTVEIFVEATEVDSSDGHGTPTQSILDNVSEVLEFDPDITEPTNSRGRRPIQANLEVVPINTLPVDITINGLDSTSSELLSNIELNIKEYLKNIRPFVAGADLARNKNDILYSARIQSIITDVLESDNFFISMDMFVSGVNQTSFLFSRENVPYLRNFNA